jgi:hypothetical protein
MALHPQVHIQVRIGPIPAPFGLIEAIRVPELSIGVRYVRTMNDFRSSRILY